MADASKHPSKGGNSISDFQTLLSPLRARRSKIVGYVLVTAFVACTVFLAFNPSAASSPWFSRFFSAATPVGPPFHVPESSTDVKSDRSVPVPAPAPAPAPLPATGIASETRVSNFSASLAKKNGTLAGAGNVMNGSDSVSANRTQSGKESVKNESKPNPVSDSEINHKNRSNSSSDIEKKGNSESGKKKSKDDLGKHENKRVESSLDSLKKCNMFQGRWVKDDSYPLYKEGSCSLIDESFDCFLNGRKDQDFLKLRWQPHACNIPRLNASDMLERLRGKRLVFVGDSLNRNMWESMVCVLRNSVKDKSKVYEKSGRSVFRTEGSASFLFQDYNCSVEFFRAPFLVQEWQASGPNGSTSERLRLDLIERKSDNYKQADIIVFNTGHWWTHEKTSRGKDYYQEGSHVYGQLNVVEAFRKALVTWARWVDANVNPHKTLVFFRGFSATHFSGGQWNSGGACDRETQPIYNEAYLSQYPEKMSVLERVIKGMKTPISYLNITRMTDYRKDGHPSIYRKQNLSEEERRAPERFQDCSHWCLPGVPDTWNEILYAQLISKQH